MAQTIWVDADACPVVIKEILFKAAQRTKVPLILVANHFMRVPALANIQFRQVESGFDIADNWIVQHCQPDDLVITADIPLASEVIDKKALALNPRGELYTTSNIKQRLNMRDFMETMRSSGIQTGGPDAFSQKDRQAFANQLDRWLVKAVVK
ncbi:YaiI/YqxD family protein [Thiomicrorhabdus sediminis]|uniref:UPF0178 protein FE785_05110 n=1 Tax=Thiomicrorhabdus sediminis TaxID=2580412 RepID=A0A4P9K4Y8_9GAMM|nr:YaiI/YqxD family protein [Thiomicrorhabdus sediminis]QCU90055.1 YaiI/YqxD family protein [Thiomicrorhabdus sediminis]